MSVDFPVSEKTHSGTQTGTYEVLAPASTTPLPVVIALHGDDGTTEIVKSYWTDAWTTRKDFIAVAMQNPWQKPFEGQTGWDDFPDDTANFLHAVILAVVKQYPVDINRIHVTGVSAGSWWMGQGVFRFQDLVASAQFSCGASPMYNPDDSYIPPAQSECKIATRFEISSTDFMYDDGQTLEADLKARGHVTEFSTTPCDGHCCGDSNEYAVAAMKWFDAHPRCGGAATSSGCQSL